MTAKTPETPQESRPAASPASGSAPPATPPPAAPAPAPAPAPRAAAKPSGSGAAGAYVTAVVALLVAIGAVAVAVYALSVAREALSKNADRAVATATSPAAAPAPAPAATTVTITPLPTTTRVNYLPELVRAELRIPAPSGCGATYVDIDTMAVGTGAYHEFYLSTCVDLSLRVDRSSGASQTTTNPSPEVCAATIAAQAQTGTELVLQARSGLTFCLLTNKTDAATQNLPQRIAVVEVRDVGVDKSVTVAVSTFRVPS